MWGKVITGAATCVFGWGGYGAYRGYHAKIYYPNYPAETKLYYYSEGYDQPKWTTAIENGKRYLTSVDPVKRFVQRLQMGFESPQWRQHPEIYKEAWHLYKFPPHIHMRRYGCREEI